MISRFEIITTSIRPSTTSMMTVSFGFSGRAAPSTVTESRMWLSASTSPNAAITR